MSSKPSTRATSTCPRSRASIARAVFSVDLPCIVIVLRGHMRARRSEGLQCESGMRGDRLVATDGTRRRRRRGRDGRHTTAVQQRGLSAEDRADALGADGAAAGRADGRSGRGAAGLGHADRRRGRLRQATVRLDVEGRVGRRATVMMWVMVVMMRAAALPLARRRQPTDVVLALSCISSSTRLDAQRTQHTRTFSRPSKLSSSVMGGSASSASAASMICRLSSPRPGLDRTERGEVA